jgi:hypothetical protein
MAPRCEPANPVGRRIVEAVVAVAGAALLAGAWRADWHWYEVHATWCYCAQVERQVALWRFWRSVAFVGGALALVGARRVLGRRAERVPTGALLRSAARTAGAVALALLASELLLRARQDHRRREPYFDADEVADARYGWRPIASRVTEHRVGQRTVRFVTDPSGYRVRSTEAQVDFARPTILSTGESVASGFALDYDETYAAILSGGLDVQVVNLAVTAYGVDQAYLRLADELPRFARPLATVTMVLPMALERVVSPERPHPLPLAQALVPRDPVAHAADELTWEPPYGQSLLGRSRVLSLLKDATGLHSDSAIDRARAVVTATARVSAEHRAFPLFVLLDWPTCLPDETGAPSIERTLFADLPVTHVHVHVPPEEYDPVMFHPDARGQRRIADAIERVLIEHGAVAARDSQ